MESEIHVIKKKGVFSSFRSLKWEKSMLVMVTLLIHHLLHLHQILHQDPVVDDKQLIDPIPP